MSFEWDDEKAEANLEKHGISFAQAKQVFDDPRAVPFEDLEHSEGETRDVMIGLSSRVFCLSHSPIVMNVYGSFRHAAPVEECKESMKMNSLKSESDQIENDEEEFQPEKMRRLPRGAFLAEPSETANPRKTKVRATLYLDSDVLDYFKQRAKQPNTAPYQTQINHALRLVMEREKSTEVDYASLLENPQFIAAVAEKVQAYQTEQPQ